MQLNSRDDDDDEKNKKEKKMGASRNNAKEKRIVREGNKTDAGVVLTRTLTKCTARLLVDERRNEQADTQKTKESMGTMAEVKKRTRNRV